MGAARDDCTLLYRRHPAQALLTVFLPDILGPCDQGMKASLRHGTHYIIHTHTPYTANLRELKTFAKSLPAMLNMAFDGKPMVELVLAEKARVSMEFGRIVKQYYHLNHLAMQAHDIFQQQPEIVDIMAAEWRALEFDGIVAQSIYMCPNAHEVLCLVQDNVHHRLSIKATVNQWAEWVYAMAEEFMTNVCAKVNVDNCGT